MKFLRFFKVVWEEFKELWELLEFGKPPIPLEDTALEKTFRNYMNKS